MEITLEKPRHFSDWLRIFCLYRKAFPASERKPFGIIRKMYRQRRTDVWCILQDGMFAGFTATVNGNGLILLDYLAVSANRRGGGIGSAALVQLLDRYAGKGVFVEIESCREDTPDRQLRERRKKFYLSAGMKERNVFADVFGVKMELLGCRCTLDFQGYRNFYRDYYSPWAAEHIKETS